MAKKQIDLSGILTSDPAAAKPLTTEPVAQPKPTPRPRPQVAQPAPVVVPVAENPKTAAKPVGLTHKLDDERYGWLRFFLQQEQVRRGDFRYSGQQFYVEAFDIMRQAIDAGLTIDDVRELIASRIKG